MSSSGYFGYFHYFIARLQNGTAAEEIPNREIELNS
jgi:hypothetical protein